MTDTFGTVSFTVLHEEMTRSQGAEISFQHIPGGNITYIDNGGQSPLMVQYALLFDTEAMYQLMETKVGGTAALVSAIDGTIANTVLGELTRTYREPAGGKTFARARFWEVS